MTRKLTPETLAERMAEEVDEGTSRSLYDVMEEVLDRGPSSPSVAKLAPEHHAAVAEVVFVCDDCNWLLPVGDRAENNSTCKDCA